MLAELNYVSQIWRSPSSCSSWWTYMKWVLTFAHDCWLTCGRNHSLIHGWYLPVVLMIIYTLLHFNIHVECNHGIWLYDDFEGDVSKNNLPDWGIPFAMLFQIDSGLDNHEANYTSYPNFWTFFSCMAEWTMLVAVELSVTSLVLPCGCPISSNVFQIPMATTQLWNIPPHFTSATEDTTFLNVWYSVRMGALFWCGYVLFIDGYGDR